MYEFHCWTVIRYHAHDTDPTLQDACVASCTAYLKKHPVLNDLNYKIVSHNGITTFLMSGLHNHAGHYVIEIYRWIGQNAPGSYGQLHINDQEETIAPDSFKVYIMRKGVVKEEIDPFFSPRIPVIEDPYDPLRND